MIWPIANLIIFTVTVNSISVVLCVWGGEGLFLLALFMNMVPNVVWNFKKYIFNVFIIFFSNCRWKEALKNEYKTIHYIRCSQYYILCNSWEMDGDYFIILKKDINCLGFTIFCGKSCMCFFTKCRIQLYISLL